MRKVNSSEYIVEKVAPLFNRKGYIGTSLSDLTLATGMTKGAIYCNFKNKEELALLAFRHNAKKVIEPLTVRIGKEKNAADKLSAITAYYRNYYEKTKESGGCPVLNAGTDSKHINPRLYNEAQRISGELVGSLEKIIERGQKEGQLKESFEAKALAKNLYSMIEGSIFMAFTHEDNQYINNMLDHIDREIIPVIKT